MMYHSNNHRGRYNIINYIYNNMLYIMLNCFINIYHYLNIYIPKQLNILLLYIYIIQKQGVCFPSLSLSLLPKHSNKIIKNNKIKRGYLCHC
jgi:hypothetical protein